MADRTPEMMKKDNDFVMRAIQNPDNGGPAFPQYGNPGMSLRDFYVGKALIGILSNANTSNLPNDKVVALAVEIATLTVQKLKE